MQVLQVSSNPLAGSGASDADCEPWLCHPPAEWTGFERVVTFSEPRFSRVCSVYVTVGIHRGSTWKVCITGPCTESASSCISQLLLCSNLSRNLVETSRICSSCFCRSLSSGVGRGSGPGRAALWAGSSPAASRTARQWSDSRLGSGVTKPCGSSSAGWPVGSVSLIPFLLPKASHRVRPDPRGGGAADDSGHFCLQPRQLNIRAASLIPRD